MLVHTQLMNAKSPQEDAIALINALLFCLTLSQSKPDLPHLKQYKEQLLDYKRELADVNSNIFSLDLEKTGELIALLNRLETDFMFTMSLPIKEMAQMCRFAVKV